MTLVADEADEAPNIGATTSSTTVATVPEPGKSQENPETALSDLFPALEETGADGDSGLGTGTGDSSTSRSSCPIFPATDYYTGPSDQASDVSPLVSSTAHGARAVRLTSLEGSINLDSLSRSTVQNKLGKLSLTPQLDLDGGPSFNFKQGADTFDDVKTQDHNKPEQNNIAVESSLVVDRCDPTSTTDDTLSEALDSNLDVEESLSLDSFGPKQNASDNCASPEYDDAGGSLLLDRSYADEQKPDDPKENGFVFSSGPIELESLTENTDFSQHPSACDEKRSNLVEDDEIEVSGTDGKSCEEDGVPIVACQTRQARYPQLSSAELHKAQVLAGTGGDPVYPLYVLRSTRLDTFPDPTLLNGVRVDRQQLANNGFFYSGMGGPCVTCFQCGSSLHYWEEGMTPAFEHTVLAPRCPATWL